MSGFHFGIRSTNSACTTSTASSRLRSRRCALRTSAGPYARYAACGSLTASTLDADRITRALLQRVLGAGAAERAVGGGRALAAVVALRVRRAVATAARAVGVARAPLAGRALAR